MDNKTPLEKLRELGYKLDERFFGKTQIDTPTEHQGKIFFKSLIL